MSPGAVLLKVTRPSVMKLVRQSLSYRPADDFLEMIDRNAIPDATDCHINLRVREGEAAREAFSHLRVESM